MPKPRSRITWLNEPEAHNYPAALSYLSLIYPTAKARSYVARLKRAQMAEFKAKDIFRASGLPLLGISNSRVKRDQQKIEAGEPLSPLLLVRDPLHGKVIVADGYHRMCALYSFDEAADVPCKIV
jgi:hypothetical protein